MDPCDINHHTLLLQYGNMWNLNTSFPQCTEELQCVLQNMGKRRAKSTAVYANQGIFLYFLCDPHPPAAILHLSLAGEGRSARWPMLQSFNFAFNQRERERERV